MEFRVVLPSRREAAIFAAKRHALRARHVLRDRPRPRRHTPARRLVEAPLLARSASALWNETDDPQLSAGKVENLRVALRSLAGVEVPAGETFSFWRQVGRPSRRRGFRRGRELREGCIVPSVGGGLCQLSNALYDAALDAGLEVVERHAHSIALPGSLAATGRDATVLWSHIDLRLRADRPWRIDARLDATELVLELRGHREGAHLLRHEESRPTQELHTCATCGAQACFRHRTPRSLRRAALVDQRWPEHDAFLRGGARPDDLLFLPLDGVRRGRARYAWDAARAMQTRDAPLMTLHRSLRSRRLSAQGAARQRALLSFDERFARIWARRLPPDAVDLTVSQTLLPFLWRDGALGGRSFDVLLTRFPLAELQARLDSAAALHPESPTLADFRADPALVEAEEEALAAARRLITPHAELAALAGERAELLPWALPHLNPTPRGGDTVVFPAPALGRKGAYELRAAARELDLELLVLGPPLEGPSFWDGVRTRDRRGNWLQEARCVVLPSFVESRPTALLTALAAGIPVLATPACGLPPGDLVTIVPAGDPGALVQALSV